MLLQAAAVETLLEDNPDGLFEALNGVLRSMIADTAGDVLDAGMALYWGLAVVLTVWTGLRHAFGGRLEMWEYWRLLVALLVPLTMLQAYDAPLRLTAAIPITLPGSADPLTFPELVTAQGTWLAQEINDDGLDAFWEFARSLWSRLWDALTLSEADGAGVGVLRVAATAVTGGAAGWLYGALTTALVLLCFLTAILAAVIGYAQVMFAQVAIAICVVLGPVLIPWILIGPLAFLFWGWFRSLLTYSLYAAVSATVLRVMLALLEGTTNRVLDAVDLGGMLSMSLAERAGALVDGLGWMLTMVVCSLAAVVSFLKIPSITSGLVSGQAGGESIGAALGTLGAAAAAGGKAAVAMARKGGSAG